MVMGLAFLAASGFLNTGRDWQCAVGKIVLASLLALAAVLGSEGAILAASSSPAEAPQLQQAVALTPTPQPQPAVALTPTPQPQQAVSLTPTPQPQQAVASTPTAHATSIPMAPSPLIAPNGMVIAPSISRPADPPETAEKAPNPSPLGKSTASTATSPTIPPIGPVQLPPATAPSSVNTLLAPLVAPELPAMPPITLPATAGAMAPSTLDPGSSGNAPSPVSTLPLPSTHSRNKDTPVAPSPIDASARISPENDMPLIVHPPLRSQPQPTLRTSAPTPERARRNMPVNPALDPSHAPSSTQAFPPPSKPTNNWQKLNPPPPASARVHRNVPTYPVFSPTKATSHPSPIAPSMINQPKHDASPPPFFQASPYYPVESPSSGTPAVPDLSTSPPNQTPAISPSAFFPEQPKGSPIKPLWTLPPPPPNLDCNSLSCEEPLTEPPVGSRCVCVLPIRVGLRLGVALYTFFPMVSDFAQEIASGVNMAQRQVRIMGANVANDQPDKSIVLVNLVPLEERFDNFTAFSVFDAFWKRNFVLKSSLFGEYEVLYVTYPGLPSSPPALADANIDDGDMGNRNSQSMKPIGVDVPKLKRKVNSSVIVAAVVSMALMFILGIVVAWLFLARWRRKCADDPTSFARLPVTRFAKLNGTGHTMLAGRRSSASGSFSSSIAAYTGQSRTFPLAEIERATNYFDDSKVLGEGGFGCVYHGTLEDGTDVAVKVLMRCDYQGEREFLAEVEMLGRLHHRNLVKLIGICVEDSARCLVYELIPNGSVESHLHGLDKDTSPLDWNARLKIALGAARGLAYLHEDSSPCVIHRDFKSSNILLDYDYTPKVSDFGLAKAALCEENQHISTCVMGTFGYVAPEYAMTGHLLVKSDVYSYGVVLLELLTGRKPVDMSRPPGQENLVSWARPLLANVVSLRQVMDPFLVTTSAPFDSVAKVAAIASMCVQPEVAHRPSMGEVVQALKLICTSDSEECQHAPPVGAICSTVGEAERMLLSDMMDSPLSFASGLSSFQRHSCSGPLMMTTGKGRKFWRRLGGMPTGSMSDCAVSPVDARSGCSDP